MLHLSLFLFLSGLVIFLFNVNHSVYLSVISWIGFFSTLYGLMTMMRIIRYNSPYYTPLSSMAWLIHNCMQHALGTVLSFTVPRHGSLQTWIRLRFLKRHYDYQVSWGVLKAAEETASVRSLKIDLGIFHWTLGSLSRAGEDDILERFFEAIPGFFNLQMVTDIQRHHFPHMFRSQFVDSLCAFLDRNLLSSTISESTKTRRLVICMNATKGVCDSDDIDRILSHLSSLPFDQVSPSIETARILSHWCNISDRRVSWSTRELVARILLYVQERDDRWIALARDQFDIPEHVLRNSVAYGDDSVLLAILIHVTRQVIRIAGTRTFCRQFPNSICVIRILDCNTNFVLYGMRSFVLGARGRSQPYVHVLQLIRQVYLALHQGTDAAPTAFDASTANNDPSRFQSSLYPLCDIPTHHTHHPASIAVTPPTQLLDIHDASRPSRSESRPTPGSASRTVPQQTREDNTGPGLPSSANHVLPHSPGFPSDNTIGRGSFSTHENTHGPARSLTRGPPT